MMKNMLLDYIQEYIFRVSIFYCKNIELDDELVTKCHELETLIKEKVGGNNV